MNNTQITINQRVQHPEYGVGIVTAISDGYALVFFTSGERRVPVAHIVAAASRADLMLGGVQPSPEHLSNAWLHWQAYVLPLMDNAAALTAAPIDLLPHQVVLTHRVATASTRRFLVADEVGLGKTIETALILRELASRGELGRALMVVPAGLVNNWHEELNTVFNLDFEVFGTEGDVTDRKSNAFAKHDRLIASIDTLKRPKRIKRLLEAPRWDLVVFDEAHHLSAYNAGKKVKKTENYKLAEALRHHARDLLLLSATPHQGDHFRFWMLVNLLDATLFKDHREMLRERHRLNQVVFRRTKADACAPDGSPLFSRRQVTTESFVMSDEESRFYIRLCGYLQDGFDLAQRQGNQGRALGFVMTIFQKIAASSFAAVRSTLRRRLLMLTLHEAMMHDHNLDVDSRAAAMAEARAIARDMLGLGDDPVSEGQLDKYLADLRLRLLKKLDQDELAQAANAESSEAFSQRGEAMAAMSVEMALPEERQRIKELLEAFPHVAETKAVRLLHALRELWQRNPDEKIVVFATYLGTVDLISSHVNAMFPGQGVEVLKGGDHGSKTAAERRFRRKDGPKLLVCTAAGREGINLQFARILFNFDLPWNPMDVEQRIGRIHRYRQAHTAQVYNLILSDTIEGKIYLLLDEKLQAIAKTLGKVDEHGNIAEDLRGQILGQLTEKLNYDQLYRDALGDPTLQRTRVELEAAMNNATEAREVVFQLFQDLARFSLDDYRPFADVSEGMDKLVAFMARAVAASGGNFTPRGGGRFRFQTTPDSPGVLFTTDRDAAQADENLQLLGLDHPLVQRELERCRKLPADQLGVSVRSCSDATGFLTLWAIQAEDGKGGHARHVFPLAISPDGVRSPRLEHDLAALFQSPPQSPIVPLETRMLLMRETFEPMLLRELQHRGILHDNTGYAAELIGWMDVV